MGVNGVVDNAASHNMAVAGSNTVSVLREIEQKNYENKLEQRVQEQSDVQKLVQNGTNPSKAGTNILASLASKLANTGVILKSGTLKGKAKDALEKDYEQLCGGKSESADMVDIQNAIRRMSQKNGQGEKGKGEEKGVDQETREIAKEYASVYAQYSAGGSQELKKKLENLEKQLKSRGLSEKDLGAIRTSAKNSIIQEITDQIRDAYLKKFLSQEKSMEMILNEKGLNDVVKFALSRGTHDNSTMQNLASEVKQQTIDELRQFTREKLEQKLMRKLLASDKGSKAKAKEDLKRLIELSGKVGLDLNEFIKKWEMKKFDLGLFLTDVHLKKNGSEAGADKGKEDRTPYDYTKDDEKDLQINRLRALHMHRALAGDWKTMLETSFKIKRAQNGLIKLNINSDELARIEKEGKGAARMRLLEALKKAFEERATLYELAGPAHNLIEKQIKGLVSNLERLGWKLSSTELESIRDAANIKVFDAAKNEFLTTKDLVKGSKNPALEKRLSLIIKLMKRVKEESKLDVEVGEVEYKIKEAV